MDQALTNFFQLLPGGFLPGTFAFFAFFAIVFLLVEAIEL